MAADPTSVPLKAVIGEVVFVSNPVIDAVTFTEKVHDAPAFRVAPDKLMHLNLPLP